MPSEERSMTAQDEELIDGRDVYELANQLGGYVDRGTPPELAAWLLREEKVAAAMADEIVRLRAALAASPSPVVGDDGLLAELKELHEEIMPTRIRLILARAIDLLSSIPAFADEGSGIGDGRGPLSRAEKDAVLAYMEQHCPHRAKETAWDAVCAFNAIFAATPSDIDRSGLAQEVD